MMGIAPSQPRPSSWAMCLLLLLPLVLLLASSGASTKPPSSPWSRAVPGARTGVLIHGCHLGAKGWTRIMWGNEQQRRLGRLPHGARLAWEENACLVVLGTGASEKEGVLEGQYALEYLMRNWERLGEFPEAFVGVDLKEMRKAVEPTMVAEVASTNTREELIEAGRLFREAECTRVILVSSPTHLPRCLRDACSVWLETPKRRQQQRGRRRRMPQDADEDGQLDTKKQKQERNRFQTEEEMLLQLQHDEEKSEPGFPVDEGVGGTGGGGSIDDGSRWRPLLLASPSDTSFDGYGADDVAIVEPPHRGDGRVFGGVSASRGSSVASPGEGVVSEEGKEEGALLLLHELVALALRVGDDDGFRAEFEGLLRRFLD